LKVNDEIIKIIDKFKGRFLIFQEKDVFIIIDQSDNEVLNRYGWCSFKTIQEIEQAILLKLKKSPFNLLMWYNEPKPFESI